MLKIIILINFHFFTRHKPILYLFESTESIPPYILFSELGAVITSLVLQMFLQKYTSLYNIYTWQNLRTIYH